MQAGRLAKSDFTPSPIRPGVLSKGALATAKFYHQWVMTRIGESAQTGWNSVQVYFLDSRNLSQRSIFFEAELLA
jgi:hypothetical protein